MYMYHLSMDPPNKHYKNIPIHVYQDYAYIDRTWHCVKLIHYACMKVSVHRMDLFLSTLKLSLKCIFTQKRHYIIVDHVEQSCVQTYFPRVA